MNIFLIYSPCIVVMAACGRTHYWSRVLIRCGHEVKEIVPQFITAYRKGNKNDYNDTEAIAEASQYHNMRFVPLKSLEQQEIQIVHRIREGLVHNRTVLSNKIHGSLTEYGVVTPKGLTHLTKNLPIFLENAENAENELSAFTRRYFLGLREELDDFVQKTAWLDKEIMVINKENVVCQRLTTINGIGPLIFSALYAGTGDGKAFKSGRHVSAWLGLVPGQNSTGGKPTLLSIFKHGNTYLRTQLINGARSALRYCDNKTDQVSVWAKKSKERSNYNNATVALVNKMARMVWAMLHHQADYKFRTTIS